MSCVLLGPAHIFESSFDAGSHKRTYSSIRTLPHARHLGADIRFAVKDAEVFELQKLDVHRQGSLFVGESVYSDGGLLIATSVDPCFLWLPALRTFSDRFVPLEQIFSCAHTPALTELLLHNAGCKSPSKRAPHRDCRHGLQSICDIKDMGDGKTFYRLSEDKVANWLKIKVLRVARKLTKIALLDLDSHQSNNGGAGMADGFSIEISSFRPHLSSGPTSALTLGACSASTSIDSQTAAASSAGPTDRFILLAIDFVSEYLDIITAKKLKELFGSLESTNVPKRSLEGSAATATTWAGRNDADEMAALAFGQKKKLRTEEGSSSNTKRQSSAANRSLQAVNKKGMRSLTAFFTTAKK